MNILFFGDIVGKIGRKVVTNNLPILIKKYDIDFVICNAENVTKGKGLTKTDYFLLKESGIDCFTLGNHYDAKSEIFKIIDNDDIVRPINLEHETRGNGSRIFEINNLKIRVTNCLGSVFMKQNVSEPYICLTDLISNDECDIHIIDFHAEATGEKKALAYSLKNTITAFVGTHTHVQTSDAQILSSGVAYISDVGMCGSYDSVLGCNIDSVVNKMILHDENTKFSIDEEGKAMINAVVIKVDDISLKASEIIPISLIERIKL